jgi:TetR/AcrR family transcriptional regulator
MTDTQAAAQAEPAAPARRKRDPERSRAAILDAAEQVFARIGYDRASLAEIGQAAGVSAALPAYFFGDKRGLHDAVIARLFADRDEALEPIYAQSTAVLLGSRDGLRRGLEILVGGYMRFLQRRPTFVQLMAREALEIPNRARAPRHSRVLARGIDRVVDSLPSNGRSSLDRDQLLITLVALCWFPLEHDATMLAGMGYATWTDEFIAQRCEHVVEVLLAVLGG